MIHPDLPNLEVSSENIVLNEIVIKVSESDSLALVALYNSTSGANWTNNSNWLTGTVDTWYGVTVENGLIIKIDLDNNNLEGTISSEVGNLSDIQSLNIANNKLLPEDILNSGIDFSTLDEFTYSPQDVVVDKPVFDDNNWLYRTIKT